MVDIDIDGNLTEINSTNNSYSKNLIINSVPIAILRIEPNQTYTHENILFNASESYNEVDEVNIQFYFFDFGDGTNSSWTTNSVVYHNYSNDGKYYVRVIVQDLSFQNSLWSTISEIIIFNRKPISNFTIEPTSGTIRTNFVFNSELANDQDGTITKYFWEFSDGYNTSDQNPTHKFDDDIEYTITLTVWDDDAAMSELYLMRLKIQNIPPNAIFTITPEKPNATEEIIFNASGTSDPDDEFDDLELTWDFDDGTYGYNQSIIRHDF